MVFRYKKTWSVFFIVLVFLALLLVVEYYRKDALVGGNRDNHGCLIAAGYSWNETDKACVREWEKETAQNNTIYRQKFDCPEALRNVSACVTLYEPVCGYPEEKTYSNSCFACINEEVKFYYQGTC